MIAAWRIGHFGVGTARKIIDPDVARERTDIALAPFILIGFFFAISDFGSVRAIARFHAWHRGDHARCATIHGDLVKLRQCAGREIAGARRLSARRGKQDAAAIWSEVTRIIIGVVMGQAAEACAICIHHEHIEIAIAIRGEGELGAIA